MSTHRAGTLRVIRIPALATCRRLARRRHSRRSSDQCGYPWPDQRRDRSDPARRDRHGDQPGAARAAGRQRDRCEGTTRCRRWQSASIACPTSCPAFSGWCVKRLFSRAGFTATINITSEGGRYRGERHRHRCKPGRRSDRYDAEHEPFGKGADRSDPCDAHTPGFPVDDGGDRAGLALGSGRRHAIGRQYSSAYGISGQFTNLIEGVSTRQGANAPGTGPDLGTLEELQIVAIAGNAEQALPGVAVNMIVKSGGNSFTGRYEAYGQHEKFQSNNLNDTLRAQGLRQPDGIRNSYEVTGDLGGRLIRDRLWFYGALREQRADRNGARLSEVGWS